jgi:alkanesulfonate monooxygenase SsuD/methylene tetrahydromethanopterin reductase-like flavin-dependent oxidoreductase (luciferase family)
MEPKPVQSPYPPIWLAGVTRCAAGPSASATGSSARIVDHGAVRQNAAVVRCARGGRIRPASRSPAVYLAVAEGRRERRDADALNRLYGFFGLRDIAAVAVAGTPADCVEGLQAVADAGADLILLNPMARERDQMEVLTTEVIPHVRRR